jgi:hypothetical protein
MYNRWWCRRWGHCLKQYCNGLCITGGVVEGGFCNGLCITGGVVDGGLEPRSGQIKD